MISGHLRVFASVTACESLLPDLLTPLRTTHPRVRISLRTGAAASALALLDQGETDLAVAALPDRNPATLLTRQITHTPLVLIQAAALTADQAPDLSKPFVLPRQGLVRTAADHWFRSLGIHPHIAAEADGHEALPTQIALGYGTGITPTSCCSTASAPASDSCPPPPAPANSPSGSASDGPICIAPLSPPPGQKPGLVKATGQSMGRRRSENQKHLQRRFRSICRAVTRDCVSVSPSRLTQTLHAHWQSSDPPWTSS
ncbi:LysR substrate-binding domain-containing protein [Streptomyces europaeiscabiei]|uniref:LysR substrate-binding domain-containing protein n=1 Tax=Streptomyces europaeiscabiei TaxID=146819 RepID=UPI0038D4D4C0